MFEIPSLRLPAGMRDFAPRAAAARRRIAETLLGVFESWGYCRVITPAFEYEEVLALGLGAAGRESALRFVEPSSGRVVALRPDITPQIARLIATRFRDEKGPIRLCYEGTVLRLERGARAQREFIQAGIELAGVASPEGDAEAIALGAAALSAAGLADATIDLGHLGLMREVLASLALPAEALPAARRAIAKRDRAGLDEVLRSARGAKAAVQFARRLPELTGDPGVLEIAARQAPSAPIAAAVADLAAIVGVVVRRGLPARLHVDLAEVRGFDYYTGVRFQGFVPGAAEPVLTGGRYDDLLGRYGHPSPAIGFAVDVEAAAGARAGIDGARAGGYADRHGDGDGDGDEDGAHDDRPMLYDGSPEETVMAADAVRRLGGRAVPLLVPMSDPDVAAYAARWGYRSRHPVAGPPRNAPAGASRKRKKEG